MPSSEFNGESGGDLERREGRWSSGTAVVCGIAIGTVMLHVATGWRYGFDRDELMALEDARHLAWGYVQYPPMTAFFGRVALTLFGTSLVGFRFFAGLVQALAIVMTGLMAKELGGGKWAQAVAALAGVPFCLGGGALMQYISFDYVCWVLVTYGTVRVLGGEREHGENGKSKIENGGGEKGEGRPLHKNGMWWLVVGAGIGLGMMAKYTMGFLAAGLVAGVFFAEARRWLRSGWLWLGVLVALGVWLPNFLWQWERGFPSLEFLKFIHERDVRAGLTDWFLVGQLELTLLALPLAVAGIWFCFFGVGDKRYRVLGWMYVVPLVLFLVMRGRDYYLAPIYPMLYAAGAVWVEEKIRGNEIKKQRRLAIESGSWGLRGWISSVLWVALVADVLVAGAVALPIAPVKSGWWRFASQVDSVFPEEIGWPEFVETLAGVRDRLPLEERGSVGILAGNYGELGALNLYGQGFALPRAISGVNSSWERGYGEVGPSTVIVAGYSREYLERYFASCVVGARVWNRYGVMNEETMEDPEIIVCRGLKKSWGEFWKEVRKFA